MIGDLRRLLGTMLMNHAIGTAPPRFAVLNVLEGTVIGSCMPRHRHQEIRTFLNLLDTA